MRGTVRSRFRGALAIGLVLLAASCGSTQVPAEQHGHYDREHTEQSLRHASSVPHLRVDVVRALEHDPRAFTQGLEVAGGSLYESTGRYGESTVRELNPRDGRVVKQRRLPEKFFGEGLTVAGDRVWQLTWKAGVAFQRDRTTLDEIRRVHYDGQGWGLCHDGTKLVMSDGSARLTFRDQSTFAATGGVTVRLGGEPVAELNELECAGGHVWANVWGSDQILRIDPGSGRVTAVVDAVGLLPEGERAAAGVLNGIAAVDGEFLLTGKNWPRLYRVRFVPR